MDTEKVVILCLIIMVAGGFGVYYSMHTYRIRMETERYDEMCMRMTLEMNANISEDSSFVEHHCYYEPHAPPEGLENLTQTACVCESTRPDGSVVRTQVLVPKRLIS